MLGLPFEPARIVRSKLGQPSFEINTLNSLQALLIGVPQGVGFPVVKNKGSLVGPSGGDQGELIWSEGGLRGSGHGN